MAKGTGERIEFGREICGDLEQAEAREWLVTNGLGGYCSGTIAGTLTRRYHGLLIAPLAPPLRRTLLVAKLDESVEYRGQTYALSANRWRDGYVEPRGFELIERFRLDGTTPVWEYAVADALIEKRIWAARGENTAYVRYRVLRAAEPVWLSVRALVNYRDFHANTHAGDWRVGVTPCAGGLAVEAFGGAVPFRVVADRGAATIENVWYRDFVLIEETRRGLDDRDDHLAAGNFSLTLAPGESVTFTASAENAPAPAAPAGPPEPSAASTPAWIAQLELAAEQFIVARPTQRDPGGKSIIAGYHWFGDWGRDTMIALPGLTLATGRYETARAILLAFAPYVDGGMLPNFFPEASETPQYNTVDGALWYVEAVAAYLDATADLAALRLLWPSLHDVVTKYRNGTRYGIRMDDDGTIVAAAPGVQLTWMDAKIGDWVVTPRMGKPVEISALWHNALERMTALAALLGEPAAEYAALARLARSGFDRFWNAAAGFCFDVIDGPDGNDSSLRPNQIFAVSLAHSPLDQTRRRGVVDACAAHLLTSTGLRTLAPSDPRFAAHYGGSPHDRDAAYHQGTVWPWLLGPFALAHYRVYGDRATALSFLEPIADQLRIHGLGTISEITDGAAPFRPNGAIAQAWSVGEILRAWKTVEETASDVA